LKIFIENIENNLEISSIEKRNVSNIEFAHHQPRICRILQCNSRKSVN